MTEELIEGARALIEKALDANAEERDRLQRSLGHLTGSAGPRKRRQPRAPARLKVRPGKRRKQVLAELEKGPGTATDLARRAGIAPTGIYPVLNKLCSDGKARKQGGVYEVVTEETGGDAAGADSVAPKSRQTGEGKAPQL